MSVSVYQIQEVGARVREGKVNLIHWYANPLQDLRIDMQFVPLVMLMMCDAIITKRGKYYFVERTTIILK